MKNQGQMPNQMWCWNNRHKPGQPRAKWGIWSPYIYSNFLYSAEIRSHTHEMIQSQILQFFPCYKLVIII